jgi:PiT family inorganic phosphate transporter
MAIILMFVIRSLTKKTDTGDALFKEPKKNQPPPPWIRGILLLTCTLVSFFHGSNDGQKGVGLMMLILIGVVPAYFALDENFNPSSLSGSLTRIEQIVTSIDSSVLSAPDREKLFDAKNMNLDLQKRLSAVIDVNAIPKPDRFIIRKDIMLMDRHLNMISKRSEVRMSVEDKKALSDHLKKVRKLTDYSPTWVILMISLSLGVGTMIGWKRIVKTVGEKIGKEHLTYAQGASAELVASSTIGISTFFGWPVSTTHVLSSGIAGSMVANKGVKNLQPETVRNILMAWLLTLPVVVIMAGTLFLLFRSIF